MSMDSPESIEIFYSYAQEDDALRNELEKHLGTLKQLKLIRNWHDQKIPIGTDQKQAIDEHLDTAHIILLLISSDFMNSDYCYSVEMQRALERHKQGRARIIPILLRPVDLVETPIASLRVLPTNNEPITLWSNRDAAFTDVSIGIRKVIQDLRKAFSDLTQPDSHLDRVGPEQISFPFTNREEERRLILSSFAPAYYLLDAPAGYGKSALLWELQKEFSERKWLCAYLALDSSSELDELAEAIAEKLSISGLLSSSAIDQGAGYRLGGALRKYWDNSQDGIVLLFDLDPDPDNAKLLERLVKEFIPEIEDSLKNIPLFASGEKIFRVVIAGRYLTSYYSWLSVQMLPVRLSTLRLTPFKDDVIQDSAMHYLRGHTKERVRQIADHTLYLTGGHPGCMAKVLQRYKERDMSPEIFLNRYSDQIWHEIVSPVVNSISAGFPTNFGVDKLMSNNVLRYMGYADLRKLVDTLEISGVWDESHFDEIDFADELTGATLLSWNKHLPLLHDDMTRRLICLGLRNERKDEFVRLCRSAQKICEDHLSNNSADNPVMWAIEHLFQFLQQHSLLIGRPEQRRELRDNFLSQELPIVLEWLATGRKPREQEGHLLRSIQGDWEFIFTVNYYLRDTEHNDKAIKVLKAEVNRILGKQRKV